jgi:hypothetical protein
VVVLRRGGAAEALPRRTAGTEHAVEQSAQRAVLDRLEEVAKLALEQLDRLLRPLGELLGVELVRLRGADGGELDLAPELGMDREAPRDDDDRPG